MLIDAGYDGRIERVAEVARRHQDSGIFDGFWLSDTNNDPFLQCGLALGATTTMTVGTNIAVAFARSPFVVAQTAWNLAGLSGGRFMLGLGPQVKPHIEKRFSMPWPDSPVAAMEEYLGVLRHLFAAFAERRPPSYRGEYYRCTLGSPVFTPDSQPYGAPPIGISAVGKSMARLAGRAADIVLLHPFTHLEYLRQVTLPALEQGQKSRPAELAPLQLIGWAFVIPDDHPDLPSFEAAVRNRMAFYASTPNYRAVLECLGLERLHQELHQLSRQGRWDEMGAALPSMLVEACSVRAPLADLPAALRERFGGIYTRVLVEGSPFLSGQA